MLAIALFIAFWVVLAVALFFIAHRGGLGGARERRVRPPRMRHPVANMVLVLVYVGLGLVLPAVLLIGNRNHSSAKVGTVQLTAGEKQGRQLFGQHCAVCHTLAAANAVGKVGPNLDTLHPSETLILHTIVHGCVQQPLVSGSPQTCLGYGTMPAGIVEGIQAQQVAAFVARAAGQPQ
jgi:mono/diheme cytochrome c family protein